MFTCGVSIAAKSAGFCFPAPLRMRKTESGTAAKPRSVWWGDASEPSPFEAPLAADRLAEEPPAAALAAPVPFS